MPLPKTATIPHASRLLGLREETLRDLLHSGRIGFIPADGRSPLRIRLDLFFGPNAGQTANPISRRDLVESLSRVSHVTWMRQKAQELGKPFETMPAKVTDHDRERARDIVDRLAQLGIWHR